MEAEVKQLEVKKAKVMPLAGAAKARAVEDAKNAFEQQKMTDKASVEQICSEMRKEVEDLLDTFPDLDAKEFAGRYEVKDLEAKLCEVYPEALVEGYKCSRPAEFSDEGEAYQAYSWVEQRVAAIKQHNVVAALFSGLTSLMENAASYEKVGAKVALVVVGLFMGLTIFNPFLLLTLYTCVGLASWSYGLFVSKIFKQLYSVKQFLNDSYDEDIFQRDRQDILDEVDDFLERTRDEYFEDIDARVFHEPEAAFQQIMSEAKGQVQAIERDIAAKQANIEQLKLLAQAKVEEYDKLVKEREAAAKDARNKNLGVFEWKNEWPETMFMDVVDGRIIAVPWTKQNTLYIGRNIEALQMFSQLVVYQNVIHVHPNFSGQVVVDYKYMGGNLLPFTRLPACLCDICTDSEKIEKKVASMDADIRARCKSILQSCASIEDFNTLMGTYGATGESYVIAHMWGLSSISANLKTFLKNGPKVGYFFKIYLTFEEFGALMKDFPFDDITEYAEVSDKVVMRTATQLQRRMESNA